ncbi:TonB-dependent siderophore receptor [Glaciecola sp. MH2013]|uniref:TonB-dependent siderophore receptor n=1 Tax=Glaciecola sp. MH2013 TaxID=2785524 RepID=UPI00189D310B|nr:TonB-dependent siderophore receptor [Glaciecola sp. MH2013]MBF7074254.1 TonB-dependent siderophore receptor [Glaciecola sp. MH2013]
MKDEKGFKKCYLATVLTALLSVQANASTVAQEPEQGAKDIERVTVIGARQAYRGNFATLETPQSELSLGSGLLEDAGAFDLSQALDLSSSVARQNNFGGLWNSFAVRGFVGDENLPSNYLVNGFNAGKGFGGSRDLAGIESVEVLKGPRAALFGRGEPGGTINLVTKRPNFEEEGYVRLIAGSYDTYRADIDYTTPLSNELAIRLVGFYEDAESFRDTIETTRQGLYPSIAWQINDNSQLVYELEYSHQEVPFDRGVIAIDNELGLIPPSRFLGEPGDGPMEADVLGHQIEFQHEFNQEWSALVGVNFRETSLEGVATETGFGDVINDEINRFRRSRDYDASYRVFRAEVNGEFELGGLRHRVIMGIDSDKFENDQVFLRVRGDQFINVFNPEYGAYELPELGPNTDRLTTEESVGIFLQDQISVSDNIDIRVGARFDDYKQELNNRRNGSIVNQSESRVSPQFGIVYKSSEALSLYAAFGENFRPLSGIDANGDGFEPNQSSSLEAGIKFALDQGNISGTVAVFKVEQENILVVDDPVAFTSAAIGEASSQGIEIDLSGEVAADLFLWASYTYVDAQTENEFFDANFGFTVEAGSPLLNIPEHQLSIQLIKSSEISGKPVEYGGGLLHVGDRNGFFGTDFELPSYSIARAFVKYDLSSELTVRAELENLFDETYYLNSFADVWVQPGTPRSFRLSATYRF